jgi:phage terminase large subunit
MNLHLPHNWKPREYQQELWDYLNSKRYGLHAEIFLPRQHGKDDICLNFECCYAVQYQGSYLHLLPQHNQVRKAMWAMINPFTGKRRIDERFPKALRKKTLETEMKIILYNDSSIQFSGSDNYDALVGGSYNGVIWSEWALSNPNSSAYLEPILDMNGGYNIKIGTPRGRNHAYTSLQHAKTLNSSFTQVLDAYSCGVYSNEKLEEIKQRYIGNYGFEYGSARFEQEYLCSFDAANIGAILARDITAAQNEGRVSPDIVYNPYGSEIHISSDIGVNDASTWWFWQPTHKGYNVFDCTDGWGINADEWCAKLKVMLAKYNNNLGKIWLPHDARNKTFSANNTALEIFIKHFGAGKVAIVPKSTIFDRVNAARVLIDKISFNSTMVKKGLDGLIAWSYQYDDEKKCFGDKPLHDWASHYGDGFSYGCQVMQLAKLQEPSYTNWQEKTVNELIKEHNSMAKKQPNFRI